MRTKTLLTAALTLACVALPSPAAETLELAAADPGWKLDGDAHVTEHLDRPALAIRTGNAMRHDVTMEDGTIELDVALTPHRAFVYVKFRIQGEGEHEEFYFRSHKSELPDAIQYTPVYQHSSGWQLYHGEGYTAATELEPERWIHVKLVIEGRRAALFVDDMETPRIVTPLVREPGPGTIGLGSFLPRNSAPDGVDTANFSNIVVRPGAVDFTFPEVTAPKTPAGVVSRWQLSAPFPSSAEGPPAEVPTVIAESSWQTTTADPSGLLALDRHVKRDFDVRWRAVAARLTINAEQAGRRRFDFGYSDRVNVLLNGQLLMAGNATYSFNFPRRQGLINLDQGTVYLPLEKGRNELVLVVDEVFGGWGLMGRFPDSTGLSSATP